MTSLAMTPLAFMPVWMSWRFDPAMTSRSSRAPVIIRRLKPSDLNDLHEISLATGHAGANAAHLYRDRRLIGHIYAAPYCVLLAEHGFVAEDASGLAGFAVGAHDTRVWEARLEAEWWPDLRRRYPAPDLARSESWSAEERRCHMIHAPSAAPSEVVAAFPAHMHLNLLPRCQRQGVGRRLYETWIGDAIDHGVAALHVGVNRLNENAIGFWRALGFDDIILAGRDGSTDQQAGRTLWLGKRL